MKGHVNRTGSPMIATTYVSHDIPDSPASLGRVGRRTWRAVWRFGGAAYKVESDSVFIERYCLLVEQAEQFRATLDTDGWTVIGARGGMTANPLEKMLRSAESQMANMEDRLGLNPRARLELNIGHQELVSALDSFDNEFN